MVKLSRSIESFGIRVRSPLAWTGGVGVEVMVAVLVGVGVIVAVGEAVAEGVEEMVVAPVAPRVGEGEAVWLMGTMMRTQNGASPLGPIPNSSPAGFESFQFPW